MKRFIRCNWEYQDKIPVSEISNLEEWELDDIIFDAILEAGQQMQLDFNYKSSDVANVYSYAENNFIGYIDMAPIESMVYEFYIEYCKDKNMTYSQFISGIADIIDANIMYTDTSGEDWSREHAYKDDIIDF